MKISTKNTIFFVYDSLLRVIKILENSLANVCSADLDIGFASLNYVQIGILGIIQGISELLPISSTAHMQIVPAVLGWHDPGAAFSAVLRQRDYMNSSFRLGMAILIATIPIGIVGLALSPLLNAPLRSLTVIGCACIGLAILPALAELHAGHCRTVGEMRMRGAVIVGLVQFGALIPSVSHSGSNLTAALFLNFKRGEAARFSFLPGFPAIALAGLKELWHLPHARAPMDAWLLLGFGLLVASISVFCAIWMGSDEIPRKVLNLAIHYLPHRARDIFTIDFQ